MKNRFPKILSVILILATILCALTFALTSHAESAEELPTLTADVPQGDLVLIDQDYEDTENNNMLAVPYEASYDKIIMDRVQFVSGGEGYTDGKVAKFDYSTYDWDGWVETGTGSGGTVNVTYPTGVLYTKSSNKSDREDYIPSAADGYVITVDFQNVTGFGDEALWICSYDGSDDYLRGFKIRTNQFAAGIWYRIKIVATADGFTATKTAINGDKAGVEEKLNYTRAAISNRKNQFSICMYPNQTGEVTEARKAACFMIDNVKLTTTAYVTDGYDKVITGQDYENIKLNTAHTYDDRNVRTVPVVDSGIPELGMVADFDYSALDWSKTNAYGGGRYYDATSQVLPYVPSLHDGYKVTFNFRNVTGYGGDYFWVCIYPANGAASTGKGFRVKTAQFETGVWYEVTVTNNNGQWTSTKTAITGKNAGTTTSLTISKNDVISNSTYNRICYAFYNVDDTGTDESGNPTARRTAHYQVDNFKVTTEVSATITTSVPDVEMTAGTLPLLVAYDTEGKVSALAEGIINGGKAEFNIKNEYEAFAKAASVKAIWVDSYASFKPLAKAIEIGDEIHPARVASKKDTTYLGITPDMNPAVTDTMSVLVYTVSNVYTSEAIPEYKSTFTLLYAGQSTSLITEIPYDETLYNYKLEDIVVVINNGNESVVTILEKVTPPTQTNVVLQLGSDKSEINFTWFSLSEADGVIYYAEESELTDGKLPADAKSVKANRTPSVKTNYFGNKGTVTGLEAGKTYYYVLVNGEDATEPRGVKIAEDGPFSFIFAGDPQIGRGYGSDASLQLDCIENDGVVWDRTLQQIVNDKLLSGSAFITSAGDQTNNSMTSYAEHELQWDAYSNHETFRTTPQVTVLGNHDPRPYSVYSYHTNVPNMLTKADGSYYGVTKADGNIAGADYYFTYNNVLFLVLNTNTFTANDDSEADTLKDKASAEEHGEFIARVMELTADMDIKWTIVLYHQSPYGSSYHGNYTENANGVYNRDEQYAYINIRRFLVPILYENGVDLILSGHDHVYTRTHVIKPAQDENGNYIDESIITPYENGSYVFADGTTTPSFVTWKDKAGVTYTDLKVSSKPVSVTNPDGIVHITGATSSGSQVNGVEFENHYAAATSKANTRQVSRIFISDDELTIITYNLGNATTDNITEIDRFTIKITEPEEPVENKITGASISVGSDLAMRYYATLAEGVDASKVSMRFTMNGNVTVDREPVFNGEKYVFTFFGIAPQTMGDVIKAELLVDGEVVAVKDNYSVRDNLLSILEDSTSDKLNTLIADLLIYGAEAQKYTGYKTDALVTDGLTLAGSTVTPTEDDLNRSATESTDNERFARSVGVRFDYVNMIYVKLTLPDTEGVTLYIGGKEAELVKVADGTYIAYSDGIYTTQFDTVFEISLVYLGEEIQKLTYTVNSYTYAVYGKGDAMTDLALALYRLGKSTELYNS